jgi:hypothetical protein
MRRGLVLTVAAAAMALSTGYVRADEPPTGARGSIVIPVGDKVHGYLRGGETHVFEAHLAKGDVYSFNLAAPKGSRLLMLVTIRDPSGHVINADAKARHIQHGRRVAIGPYRVPKTGTYSIELAGDGPYEGEYNGASKVKAKRATYALPTGLVPLQIPVAAGATIKLNIKGDAPRIVAALPDQLASDLSGTDPFVTALRSRGLASSASATYGFSAPDSKDSQVSVSIRRPNWKAATVEFPTLPADAKLREQRLEWFAGWQPVPPVPAASTTTPVVLANPVVASDFAAGSTTGRATLFVNGRLDAATAGATAGLTALDSPPPVEVKPIAATPPVSVPPQAPDPSVPLPPVVAPPVPPIVAPPVVPVVVQPPTTPPSVALNYNYISRINGSPLLPSFEASKAIGKSAFLLDSSAGEPRWRNAPWTTIPLGYPKLVYDRFLPISDVYVRENPKTEFGPESDPFVRRTFTNMKPRFGLYGVGEDKGSEPAQVVTTVRYFVEGHQVSDLLIAGGDTTVVWTVEGKGHTNSGREWTIDGEWKMLLHTSPDTPTSALLTGREHFQAGTQEETVYTDGLTIRDVPQAGAGAPQYDVVGTILNELKAPDAALTQLEERILQPTVYTPGQQPVKATVVRITTNDTETLSAGSFIGAYWSQNRSFSGAR